MTDDKRKTKRLELSEDIMFSNRSVHPFCYYGGTALNISVEGLCFQSRYEAVPGDNLCLRMIGTHLQSFNSLDELTCIATVRWCKSVGSPVQPAYQVGLQYLGDIVPKLFKP